MVKIFHARHKHVNFSKSQIQEKEKELKRDYRLLKEARKQSGVGWNQHRCMIEADPDLWNNIITSWPRIKKFRNKHFSLFDLLGELYDGHTAEGTYNITSAAEAPPQPDVTQLESGGEFEAEREVKEEVDVEQNDDEVDVVQRRAAVENEEINQRRASGSSRKKPQKEAKRRNPSGDGVAGAMEKYLEMHKKQAEDEAAQLAIERAESKKVQDYSINRCIAVLHKMGEVTRDEKVEAYKVFKTADNREIFLNVAAEEEETVVMWLHSEMAELPRGNS